jgi:glutaconate CoA-transferase subunit A
MLELGDTAGDLPARGPRSRPGNVRVRHRRVPVSVRAVATFAALADAVETLVRDGTVLAVEGDPLAAARVLLRRRLRELTLVSLDPGAAGDALVGAGCVTRLVVARTPGARTQEALVAGSVSLTEHTALGLTAGYAAGAAGLPCGLVGQGYVGTDLTFRTVRCPFTGRDLTAVPALTPDLAIVHAPRADRAGNVQLDGVPREVLYAAARSLVTVDEIVERVSGEVVPAHVVTTVAPAPAVPVGDREALAGGPARFGEWLAGVRA